MSKRILVGFRPDGDAGLFVAPAGLNADTALYADLILGLTTKLTGLIMQGQIAGSGTVTLGLSRKPFVFLYSQAPLLIPTVRTITGPSRPSPIVSITDNGDGGFTIAPRNPSYATINGSGASMSINAPQNTFYQVYNTPFA